MSDEPAGKGAGALRPVEQMLTEQQRRQFASDGYVLVPGVVDETRLGAADAEVDELVVGSPAPVGTIGAHFYFLPPDRLSAADAALRDSDALGLADELVAPNHLDHALGHIQVALNIPPYDHRRRMIEPGRHQHRADRTTERHRRCQSRGATNQRRVVGGTLRNHRPAKVNTRTSPASCEAAGAEIPNIREGRPAQAVVVLGVEVSYVIEFVHWPTPGRIETPTPAAPRAR